MTASSDSRINSVIAGKYRIERRIARGGMGSVYLATHEMMNRKVALKLLHEKFHSHEQKDVFFKRFLREARAASQLEHPNAVTIYDFGLDGEIPYLAMQYIEGRNISSILAENGPFSIERALPLFEQICSALQAAHELTIAHRDIKPDNILLSDSDTNRESAHVLDFGIAKAMVGSSTMVGAMTAVGKTVGTPRYMSPEQAMGNDVDLRTDVYSLAIVFYEMLAGDIPFSADTPVELMYEHLNSPPKPFPKELNLPTSFQDALFVAMAKDPAKRYESPNALFQALQRSLDPDAQHTTDTSFSPKPLLYATAIGAVLSVGFFVYVLSSSNQTQQAEPFAKPRVAESDQEVLGRERIARLSQIDGLIGTTKDASTEDTKALEENSKPVDTASAASSATVSNESASSTALENEIASPESSLDITNDSTSEAETNEADEGSAKEEAVKKEPVQEEPTQEELLLQESEEGEQQDAPPEKTVQHKKVAELINDLGAESRKIRIEAAIELQRRGQKPVPALINALHSHQSPRVRYLAAFILGKMKAKKAIPALKEATNDSSGMVAETAKRALRSMQR